jgi:mono/diheme cytochrome c family protein
MTKSERKSSDSRRWIPGGLVAIAALGACLGVTLHAQGDGGATPRIWAGVYSTAQASSGETTYAALCSRCHNPDLSGGQVGASSAPALAGEKFMARWESNNVDRLYRTILDTMPRNAPGTLSEPSALALTAFILKSNGFPAGPESLNVQSALERVAFVPKDGLVVARPVGDFALVEASGCAERSADGWVLLRATQPVAARGGALTASGASVDLGDQTIRLVSAAPFQSSLASGRAVRVKGIIRNGPGQTFINLTGVAAFGASCAR